MKHLIIAITLLASTSVYAEDEVTELSEKWWAIMIESVENNINIAQECADEMNLIKKWGEVCNKVSKKYEISTAKKDMETAEIELELGDRELEVIQKEEEKFDELIDKFRAIQKTITEPINGENSWSVREKTSEIDDSKSVYLSLESKDAIIGSYSEQTPTIIIRCVENKTQAYVNIGAYLGYQGVKVTTRFDKDKAKTKRWSLSTDGKAVFVRGGNIKWIKELMKHETLTMRVAPYNEGNQTFSFDIVGLEDAIKPLREACHW